MVSVDIPCQNCRHTGTDYGGGDLYKVQTADTEEKCVKQCQSVSDCIAITFVGPNPSQYPSSLQGCYMKKRWLDRENGWKIHQYGLCRYTLPELQTYRY